MKCISWKDQTKLINPNEYKINKKKNNNNKKAIQKHVGYKKEKGGQIEGCILI